ncbi:DJ-1/PfpI family protein [bacterium]|nr:DJ-1/PfpI family protein [bacterium]
MPTALVPLIDGFEEVEAIAAIDLMRRGGIDVTTAGIGKQTATGSHDIQVQTDAIFADVQEGEFDAVVLPGGPGAAKLNDVPGLHDLLRRQAAASRVVAAICAAPTVLAAAGLLEDRRATCFPKCEGAMAGATVVREPVVEDGNFITSRGVGTAVDFGLALVARLVDRQTADQLAQSIVFEHA